MRQEILRTFDMANAKSWSYLERHGTSRGGRKRKAARTGYPTDAEVLPLFWQPVVAKQTSCGSRRGVESQRHTSRIPPLLMQAHDLKSTFAAQSLNEVLY